MVLIKSDRVDKNLDVLKTLRTKVKTIQTSSEATSLYGKTKANLERLGQMLDDADLLIASMTLVSKEILVTNKTNHFKRIPELKMENWK